MFKVEITTSSGVINKVFQNKLDEDWVRYLLTKYNVPKENIKIYWVKNLDKKNYERSKIDLSEVGKVCKGEKIKYKLTGSAIKKEDYENLVNKLGAKNLLDSAEFKSNKKVKMKHAEDNIVDALDLGIFNKEWFLKESEYQLVELRFPYDENMKFIGFNFDPNA